MSIKVKSPNKGLPYQNLDLTDLPGEQWDDIPWLDGAYQISNYGRIKSLRRWVEIKNGGRFTDEKIIKTRVSVKTVSNGKRKAFRISGSVSFEGKRYGISIARLVYYLFVKKFKLEDRCILVTCKDENIFNIRPDNLVLTTPSKRISKAYQKNHRPRESFGNNAKPVSQYDLKGKWLNTYPSLSMAAIATGIKSSSLWNALNLRDHYSNGYIWQYGTNKENISIPKSIIKKKISDELYSTIISQYDLNGIKIKEFKNLKAAAKAIKAQPNSIRRVILGDSLSAKGFYWLLGPGPQKISLRDIDLSKKEWKKKICRPITQYTLEGNKIQCYESIAEASRYIGIPADNIFSVLNEGNRISGGFLWRYGNGPKKIITSEKVKRKQYLSQFYQQNVTQYNNQGNRIAIYSTVKEAAEKGGIRLTALVDILTGKHISGNGYYWCMGKGKSKISLDKFIEAKNRKRSKMWKPVVQYDLNGNKIKEFKSIDEASRLTNTPHSNIRLVAKGKYKAANGYIWRFLDKDEQ